jgi:hypothetical protein
MPKQNSYQVLEKKLAPYNIIMGKAADTIMDQDVSSYPIFVIPEEPIALGIVIVEGETEHSVRIHATTLEELVTKNIIQMNKVDHFREVYKDPSEFLCLLVIKDTDFNFIFLPRLQVDN